MSIASAAAWEVRASGSDANGGGYVSGGTDYSQQDAAQIAVTDAVASGTTTITSASAGFTSAVVGNIIYLAGGSGSLTATRRQVTGFTNSTTITVDSTVASGTGITLNLGGALASPGIAAAFATGGNTVWWKSGSYTASTSTVNVSNGRVQINQSGNTLAMNLWRGYQTTRGDVPASQPTLTASGISSTNLILVTGSNTVIADIAVDGASLTGMSGIVSQNTLLQLVRCTASNCPSIGIDLQAFNNGKSAIFSRAVNCGTGFNLAGQGSSAFACTTSSCTTGFACGGGAAVKCIAVGGTTGFSMSGNVDSLVAMCLAYDCTTGFMPVPGMSGVVVNSLAVSCTTGFSGNDSRQSMALYNCAGFNTTNVANFSDNGLNKVGFITLTGNPLTNPGSGDYSLNNTAGAGASCRAAGLPATFPGVSTTADHSDIGAVQHADPVGGVIVIDD